MKLSLAFLSATLFAFTLTSNADELTLTTEKGFELKASYYQSHKTSNRAVLLLHQCNYNRTMYNDIGKELAKQGIHALSLDFRGFGESTNEEFNVVGKRKVLNYDRQRKSEEGTISIEVSNTLSKDIKVRLIEHIYGDWVIRDASANYRKEDASTIHFPLMIPANTSKIITYTYRKEWK